MTDITRSPGPPRAMPVRIRLALAIVLGAMLVTSVGWHALVLTRNHDAAQRRRISACAELWAAANRGDPATMRPAAPTDLVRHVGIADSDSARSAARFAQLLVSTRNATAAAVTDDRGAVAFYWPPVEDAPRILNIPRNRQAVRVPHSDGVDVPVWLGCAPLSGDWARPAAGYACVLSETAADHSAVALQCAALAGGLGVAALLGMLLFSRQLRRQLIDPLRQISADDPAREAELPVDRDDEVGAIARRLNELCTALKTAREDAERLRRSIDSTVTRQTKRISRQLRRAEREAELDPLTGLANRRFIDERLEAVFSEQRSRGVNLAIAMFDVDNFKPLNDQVGHTAGDALLRFIGELLRGSLRAGDVGVRYGGDEFALVLVDVTGAQARSIAERIIRLFAQQAAAARLPIVTTLSAGVASLDEQDARSGAELLSRADDLLYRSKRRGKNLVTSDCS